MQIFPVFLGILTPGMMRGGSVTVIIVPLLHKQFDQTSEDAP